MSNEVSEEFDLEENKSQLIRQLLQTYYHNTRESLQASLIDLKDEQAKIVRKLKRLEIKEQKKAKADKEKEARLKKNREKNNLRLEDYQKVKSGEMTQEDYNNKYTLGVKNG